MFGSSYVSLSALDKAPSGEKSFVVAEPFSR